MDIKKFNKGPIQGKRVLIAPLDWGLGHATRCVPIIKALIAGGNTVIVAANPAGKALLAAEFPGLSFISLPAYAVRLGGYRRLAVAGFVLQLRRLIRAINQENAWLKETCETESIDVVISDNRYGLYNKNIHCIFITHQLFISSGFGARFDRWLMSIHFRLISRFNECWVPDSSGPEGSAAGRLSHPPKPPPFPVTYIGLLSRFAAVAPQPGLPVQRNAGFLILLSGPEPQRTTFENLVIKQIGELSVPVLIVRGLPGDSPDAFPAALRAGGLKKNHRIVNHLTAGELRQEMMFAGTIVCRSGYSTLMDLIALQRPAVLVPTPGQPEQEYLAAYMSERGWMITQSQARLSLTSLQEVQTTGSRRGHPPLPGTKGLFFTGEISMLTPR